MNSEARKKVLILSLSYYPRFVGGAEVAVKEITDRIPEIEFHMITLRYDSSLPKVERMGNVLVHRIGFSTKQPSIADLRKLPLRLNKFLFQFLAATTALSLYRQYRYDALWAVMAHACGIPAGIVKSFRPSLPYLLTLQEGDPPESIERAMTSVWPLFAQGFRKADALQSISTFLEAWGKRRGFTGRSEVIPNGVDTTAFSREFSEEEIQGAKERIGKKPGDTTLITMSRLVHKNAVDDVIRALALLPSSVQFIVCGMGPDEAKLRALADELKVADRVRFLGDMPHAELPLLLRASDIFIRPSRSEGMGNAFIEAFAAGVPVIGTQAGGIRDFLTHKETGWVVDVDAPDQIADAVKSILSDPQKAVEVSHTAKELALKEYDWKLIAERMKSLFTAFWK